MNDDTVPLLGKDVARSYDAVGHNGRQREGTPSCCSGGGCGSSSAVSAAAGPARGISALPDNEAKEGSCCADGSVSDCCARLSVGPDGTATLTCLAIIRPDGSAVDVFDTRGSVRTFRTLSGLLALSFDGSGRHEAAEDGRGKEEGDGGLSRQGRHEASLPVSESMPAECNSGRLRSHLAERGYSLGQWLRYRQGGRRGPHPHQSSASSASSAAGASCRDGRSCSLSRGIYSVRHGGHVDYLVHNSETNELHLEYHCGDCGGVDIHGQSEHVNTWSWFEDGPGGRRRFDLHVYEVPTGRPFQLLDVLEGLFELESQRVGTVRHLGPRVALGGGRGFRGGTTHPQEADAGGV